MAAAWLTCLTDVIDAEAESELGVSEETWARSAPRESERERLD